MEILLTASDRPYAEQTRGREVKIIRVGKDAKWQGELKEELKRNPNARVLIADNTKHIYPKLEDKCNIFIMRPDVAVIADTEIPPAIFQWLKKSGYTYVQPVYGIDSEDINRELQLVHKSTYVLNLTNIPLPSIPKDKLFIAPPELMASGSKGIEKKESKRKE